MVFTRLFENESLLGVDIGSKNIKLVLAEPSKHGARISQLALCPTPADSVKEGIIANIPEVASAIQNLIRTAGIRASNAITSVAGPGVIVRNVKLPKMAEQVLRKSIYFEAGKYISAPIEDCIVDFEILGDAEEGMMEVILVAAPRIVVEGRVSVLESAGLEPLSVDIEAFATLRALVEYSADNAYAANTVALLDIGAGHTEINLVSNGKLALTRTIPIGGNSITHAIKSADDCSVEEAETRKLSLDLTESADSAAENGMGRSLKAAQSMIDEILREIRRSINYYQSQLPEGSTETTINRLVITGGTARMKGIVSYANSMLNIETMIGDPGAGSLKNLSFSGEMFDEEDIPLFNTALGLVFKEMPSIAKSFAA